jgi:hypothetical protein
LRKEIARLREFARDDLEEDKTFAVGPRAPQFSPYLEELLQSVMQTKKKRSRK